MRDQEEQVETREHVNDYKERSKKVSGDSQKAVLACVLASISSADERDEKRGFGGLQFVTVHKQIPQLLC